MSEEMEPDRSTYREVREFLITEANLIDDRQFDEWLELMTDDVQYTIPARFTQEGGESDVGELPNVSDNRFRLEKRVDRLETEYAWSEQPPSRTRHHISTISVSPADDPDELDVASNLLLFVNRVDLDEPVNISAKREDTLRRVDGELKLAERTVLLDHTTLPTSISFFI